jgi:hypothetical protein
VSALDREVRAERSAAVQRHLAVSPNACPRMPGTCGMASVHGAAREGPPDLLRFLAVLRV